MSEVYVMVTICSRKNMPRFVDCYKDYNVEAANISLGRGTASSDVLDLLGLEDDEKGIHMSLVTEDTWKNVKKGLQSKLRIDVPGTGIAFIVPLSSIGGKRELGFLIDGQEYKKGDESTLKDTKHELIVAIANYGYNTQVMRAAEEGGATGGTVLHGKGVWNETGRAVPWSFACFREGSNSYCCKVITEKCYYACYNGQSRRRQQGRNYCVLTSCYKYGRTAYS